MPIRTNKYGRYAFLARDDETNKRFDRVMNLIDGYEDSYGMELLSTMHWVMVHHEDARNDVNSAMRHVHGLSARKQRLLKAAHLEKAWQRLKEQEWDFNSSSIGLNH